ncbi:MAG TPA: YdeI/OmpD-associated family protein [Roseiarcus sp.]|nr:YdeI/OmpD-associated family protein [Roseiarcus sp.]
MPPKKSELPILSFSSVAKWESWLAREPRSSPGLWVKFAKKGASEKTLSRQEAVDGALCHGWIDGQLNAFDEEYFLVRFTPRRAGGKWSEKNRQRAESLVADGRIAPAGLAEIDAAKADGRWEAAYPRQSAAVVPDDLKKALEAKPAAFKFFAQLSSANRYAILYRLHHAKGEAARAAKMKQFVAMLARGEAFHPQRAKEK